MIFNDYGEIESKFLARSGAEKLREKNFRIIFEINSLNHESAVCYIHIIALAKKLRKNVIIHFSIMLLLLKKVFFPILNLN